MYSVHINVNEVLQMIQSLKKVLRQILILYLQIYYYNLQVSDYIIKPLTCLINLSLSKGIFPQVYKNTIISIILKAGDIKELSNYRPIGIISAIAKILEKYDKLPTTEIQ